MSLPPPARVLAERAVDAHANHDKGEPCPVR